MPYRLDELGFDNFYHVYNRGAGRSPIFMNPVVANIVRSASEWEFSDFRIWVNPESRTDINAHPEDSDPRQERLRVHEYREMLGLPAAAEYGRLIRDYLICKREASRIQKYLFD